MPHQRVRIIIIWLFSGLFLLACSKGGTNTPDKYQPVKNPNPKYFLTLTGKVLGKRNGNFTLNAVYATVNEKCYKMINSFEGASGPRQRKISYNIDLSEPTINLKIPFQYFQPGFCQWTLININHDDKQHGGETIFAIRKSESDTSINHINIKYNNKNGWAITSPNYRSTLLATKNYYLSIIFYSEELSK